MSRYRANLPQLGDTPFLTDGGLETTLIFHEHIDLPDFAAFHLLASAEGTAALRAYFMRYAALARKYSIGCILESATWRANPDWGHRLGYSPDGLDTANRAAIDMLVGVRSALEAPGSPMVISGCVGPRGDGYVPGALMSAEQAQEYHTRQIGVFARSEADMVLAMTMNYVEEAVGITAAARAAGIPAVISFTVETDGNLPTGQTLRGAIEQVDAETGNGPAYYMINCAHPSHFAGVLADRGAWTDRIRGLRVNASRRSHAELNDSTDLDMGDPVELGREHRELTAVLKNVRVLGGCCGTDHRHVEEIVKACIAPLSQPR